MAFTKKIGGWFRDQFADSDPFWVGLGLDDLEERIEDAFAEVIVGEGGVTQTDFDALEDRVEAIEDATGGAASRIGLDASGTAIQPMAPNYKYASPALVTATGTLIQLIIDVDGLGTTTSGSQVFKLQVHSDSSGSPANLLGQTSEVTIPYGTDRTRMTVALSAPINVTAGQTVHLGFHAGTTGAVARYGYSNGAGSYRYSPDTYSDGAAATFGAATTQNGQSLAIAGVVTPGVDSSVTIIGNDVNLGAASTLNFTGAGSTDVSVSNGTVTIELADPDATAGTLPDDGLVIVGDASVTDGYHQQALPVFQAVNEFNGVIEAGATFTGDWGNGGSVLVTARSTNADAMVLSDSPDQSTTQDLDGVTLAARGSLYVGNMRAATSNPYTVTSVTVGGSASTVQIDRVTQSLP